MYQKKECIAMLLAGGQGSRLYALTQKNAKPAVLFGGKYRIIDFPLSNCVNSGIDTVGVLTQYQPLVLNDYIGNGLPWDLDRNSGGVKILPPYQGESSADWYSGTANAIYQNLAFIDRYDPEYVLILSGDHIYKMDYARMLAYHKKMNASCTIAVIDVPLKDASRFGIMSTMDDGAIYKFSEKPKNPDSTKASMGIYIFNRKKLEKYLIADEKDKSSSNDFGKNIIPNMLRAGERMYAYSFEGYWKDVGTIRSLWEANMDILGEEPTLSLRDEKWRIYSRYEPSAPQFIGADARVNGSCISEGCEILGTVKNSVLGIGVRVEKDATVEHSVILGGSTVKAGAAVRYAILDENVTVGENAVVGGGDAGSEGIAVVGAQIQIPSGGTVEAGAMVGDQRDASAAPASIGGKTMGMNKTPDTGGNSTVEDTQNTKRILFVGAEAMPFAATGGLGDVLGSLPAALVAAGRGKVDVRVVMPLHGTIGEKWRAEMQDEYTKTVRLGWRRQYCHVKSLKKEGVTYYFIDNEYYYNRPSLYGSPDDAERYAFLCMAALDLIGEIGFYPDVLHAHDWQAALSVLYLEAYFRRIPEYAGIRTLFTIHNVEYQGVFDSHILRDVLALPDEMGETLEHGGSLNLMKGAIELADRVSTVSPRYAKEITEEAYACGLHRVLRENAHKLSGILNGIDYGYYDPRSDTAIPAHYTADNLTGKAECKAAFRRAVGLRNDPDAPLVAIVSRLVPHKGIDLVAQLAYQLVGSTNLQFVVLGKGEERYESFFRRLEASYKGRVRALIEYDRDLSKRIYAASDILLMPSRSEPCGLSQMIASRYGTVPVTRETGGLYDSVKGYGERDGVVTGNGFTFSGDDASDLDACIRASLALYGRPRKWERLVRRVMRVDFSWMVSAERYLSLYGEM